MRFFTFLFIFSIFVGVLHELNPAHPNDGTCEICIITHAPALINESVILPSIDINFEPFGAFYIPIFYQAHISLQARSPPLS